MALFSKKAEASVCWLFAVQARLVVEEQRELTLELLAEFRAGLVRFLPVWNGSQEVRQGPEFAGGLLFHREP